MEVDCARCGRYRIGDDARAVLANERAPSGLTASLREAFVQDGVVRRLDLRALVAARESIPALNPAEKQLRLLANLAALSEFPGFRVRLRSDMDFNLAWAANEHELRYYLRALAERGLVTFEERPTDTRLEGHQTYAVRAVVTSRGWEHLDALRRSPAVRTQAFVAMAFADEMRQAWTEGIAPAIRDAGYQPLRIDEQAHTDRIDVRLMAEIQRSRFLVADVTLQRAGVYFEAGYALGLGLPVIWSVRHDQRDEVHFDTRQYRHIVWRDEADLRRQLSDFVLVVVGPASGKGPG
jgi:nucleoside 2-deoxyribosyltransferase